MKKCKILATFYINGKRVGPPQEFIELDEAQALKAEKAKCVKILPDLVSGEVKIESNFVKEIEEVSSIGQQTTGVEDAPSENDGASEIVEDKDLDEELEVDELLDEESEQPVKRRGRPKKGV